MFQTATLYRFNYNYVLKLENIISYLQVVIFLYMFSYSIYPDPGKGPAGTLPTCWGSPEYIRVYIVV